jgi:hypothetical protein
MGNFSRNTFNPQKGYVSVRLQQGVPLVDADWNELSDVTRHEAYDGLSMTCPDGIRNGLFFLSGGPNSPTVIGGAGIVGGRPFRTGPIDYDVQPWRDPARAASDGVPVIPPLTTPATNRTDICYIDIWEREVDSAQDANLINPAIGVETSVRVNRTVALRVAEGTSQLPPPPPNHAHLSLALFHRQAGVDTITAPQRQDIRSVLNVAAFPPLFSPRHDAQGNVTAGWALRTVGPGSGKVVASNMNRPVWGVLPLSLPSGASIRLLRITASVVDALLNVSLRRQRVEIEHGDQDVLVSDAFIGASLTGSTMFDRALNVPRDGREIVSNDKYNYMLEASTSTQPCEIHGVTVAYEP